MPLEPLRQWRCDTCGDLIQNPHEGTVEYRCVLDAQPAARLVDFRIVHNGNVNNGSCQRAAKPGGDICLELLSGERGILRMLGRQSTDPTWAETVRRVVIPHYEEARRWFGRARADGMEVIDEKLTREQLLSIIKQFSE